MSGNKEHNSLQSVRGQLVACWALVSFSKLRMEKDLSIVFPYSLRCCLQNVYG